MLLLILQFNEKIMANSDSQCCRKQIQCYECDSRFDNRCGKISLHFLF